MSKPEYLISAVYFPQSSEAEFTWENLDTGKRIMITAKVTKEQGKDIAEVIPPCVYVTADRINNQ